MDNTHVFHIFNIRTKDRNALKHYLDEKGIETVIHYPIAIHLQEAYTDLGIGKGKLPIAEQIADEELSLPLYYGMTDEEVTHVINYLNAF